MIGLSDQNKVAEEIGGKDALQSLACGVVGGPKDLNVRDKE